VATAISMAMIEMTTRSSMRVNAWANFKFEVLNFKSILNDLMLKMGSGISL